MGANTAAPTSFRRHTHIRLQGALVGTFLLELLQPHIQQTVSLDSRCRHYVEENQTNEAVSISETYTQIVAAPAYIQDEDEIQKEYKRRTRNGYIFGFLTALLLFVILFLIV